MKPLISLSIVLLLSPIARAAEPRRTLISLDADVIEDKIRGGLLAQIIGNLNGLPHEFKYIDEPGQVVEYTPALPDGAFTDDDTDIEWVYVHAIAAAQQSRIPPSEIANLWKRHINRRIFCANHYARQLMDLGLEPPWTGNAALNPWSEFNISGQFLCESFGLMAPVMPQAAARTGLHYTRVAIDGEPAQATQLFTAMIATAFIDDDVDRLLDAGLASVDLKCEISEVVRGVRDICRRHPDDWQAARREIKARWQTHGGGMRDRNGYELNTASTIAALVYGKKDLAETLRIAFNLGWDCDNNAATAGTIVGVVRGRRWMNEQGWQIKDVYRNTTRDDMPMDATITDFEDDLIACTRLVIEQQGGAMATAEGRRIYRIAVEQPANVEPLPAASDRLAEARAEFMPHMDFDLSGSPADQVIATYAAICLGEADRFQRESPEAWAAAVGELQRHDKLVEVIFRAPPPAGERLQQQARRAGLTPLKK